MSGPTYTYTANTPQAANPMNQTASLIRANFQAIAELIAVNHVGFNSSNSGKHNFLSLINTTTPGPVTGEISMFSQVTGSPNPCELFIQYPEGDTVPVEISEPTPIAATGTSGGNATQGWCSFPSGVLFRWGTFSCAANSNPPVYIYFTEGPYYTQFQYPACVAPTSYGLLMPTGMTVYYGMGTGYGTNTPVALIGYVSTSTVVNSNFLLMGI